MEEKKEVEESKPEEKVQVVTNEQLIHYKLDNISLQIRELINALTGMKK